MVIGEGIEERGDPGGDVLSVGGGLENWKSKMLGISSEEESKGRVLVGRKN